MLAGEDGSGASQDSAKIRVAKTDLPGPESHHLCKNHLVKMSCLETQTVPSRMLLSYPMSSLLRKEHALLHAVLTHWKSKLGTLRGSSSQHKPKFHFVLQEKQGPHLPLSFPLLKATAFVSVPAYVRTMVWTNCCNEENCVLGSVFCRHQTAALFSAGAPFHFYLTKKEIALTVFRTI